MKTGDSFQDAQGGGWQLGQLLGRGLWGKSYACRRESDDAVFVLKTALGPEDFRAEIGGAEAMFEASREAVLEQARIYGDARHAFLPRLEARVTMPTGAPGFVVPRLSDSLERRILDGLSTASLLDAAQAVVRLARQLPAGWHGGLRPTNVLYNDRGEMFLTDVATPAQQRALALFLGATPSLAPGFPPEVVEHPERWSAGVDTWSVAMWLWRGAMSGAPAPNPPRGGLDKAGQVALRDRVQDRLKVEDANPRFHTRVAERFAVLAARALSREAAPSPPYRFPQLDEFAARVEEVGNLIRPQVTAVGKVLLDRPAARPTFDTDEVVAFSSTVACTVGVEGPEEVGVGIAVFDLAQDERLKSLDLQYTVDKHPGSGPSGGRYRFAFKIKGLYPGHFRIRLAFAIRDSGQPPATTEVEVNVVPAAGWAPPPEIPTGGPLPFHREVEEPTRPGVAGGPLSPPNGSTSPGAAMAPAVAAAPVAPSPTTPPAGSPGVPSNTVSVLRRIVVPQGTIVPAGGSGGTSGASPATPRPVEARTVRAPLATPSSPRPAARPAGEDAPAGGGPSVGGPSVVVAQHSVDPFPSDLPTVAVPAGGSPPVEEPAIPRASWADEPLPTAQPVRHEVPVEAEIELPEEPGLTQRVMDQLRNDPILAFLAGMVILTLILLFIFLALRA